MATPRALNSDYHPNADVVHLSFGEPPPGYGEDLNAHILLMRSRAPDEIVGMTVSGFRQMGGVDVLVERLQHRCRELRIPLIVERAEELRERAAPPRLP